MVGLVGRNGGKCADVLPEKSMIEGTLVFQTFLRLVGVEATLVDAYELADEIMQDKISEYFVAAEVVEP